MSSIDLIKATKIVNNARAYWFAPKPGDTDCCFGITLNAGRFDSWHLERFPVRAPKGPDDDQAIARLLKKLWDMHKKAVEKDPRLKEHGPLEEDIYRELAQAYGVTLE